MIAAIHEDMRREARSEMNEVCVVVSRCLASLQNTAISARKRRRTVMCFVHGVGASVTGVMFQLEGRMTPTSDVTTVRSLQTEVSIFVVLAKHLYFVAETTLYGAVFCTWGRDERCWRDVLARRACGTDERQNFCLSNFIATQLRRHFLQQLLQQRHAPRETLPPRSRGTAGNRLGP